MKMKRLKGDSWWGRPSGLGNFGVSPKMSLERREVFLRYSSACCVFCRRISSCISSLWLATARFCTPKSTLHKFATCSMSNDIFGLKELRDVRNEMFVMWCPCKASSARGEAMRGCQGLKLMAQGLKASWLKGSRLKAKASRLMAAALCGRCRRRGGRG